jgi:hypothetical protein
MEENKAIVAEIEQLRGEIAAMVQSPSQEAKRVL